MRKEPHDLLTPCKHAKTIEFRFPEPLPPRGGVLASVTNCGVIFAGRDIGLLSTITNLGEGSSSLILVLEEHRQHLGQVVGRLVLPGRATLLHLVRPVALKFSPFPFEA
jgi:hypothetical protein